MELNVVSDGIVFAEGPRWHDGRLWFSDIHGRTVYSLTPGEERRVECEVPNKPSGLGWLPDGRLLIVSMQDRKMLRRENDGTLVAYADLSDLSPGDLNDMVVDAQGRAYVGNFGFDFYAGEERKSTCVILVEPDGTAQIVAEDIAMPNGTVITPDGDVLIIAESFANRLTAFDIDADGSLSGRRIWAELPEDVVPDGICMDAERAIWLASPFTDQCLRVFEGGKIDAKVPTGRHAIACVLGGEDRKTLYICTSEAISEEDCLSKKSNQIVTLRVDVPGAGVP
jgi:sugar lactone lactonase YvrE